MTLDEYCRSEHCLVELIPVVGVAESEADEWVAVNMPACTACLETRQIWQKKIPRPLDIPAAGQSRSENAQQAEAIMASDRSRRLLGRFLLYGSPFVAAVLMLSVRQLIVTTNIIGWWWIDGFVFVGHGLLAALASAAGAMLLPNRLSTRLIHALAAGLVSLAVYIVLLTAAATVIR